ncbi:hypothetical protein GCM10028868_16680 [Virgibacillus kimchii]
MYCNENFETFLNKLDIVFIIWLNFKQDKLIISRRNGDPQGMTFCNGEGAFFCGLYFCQLAGGGDL